MSASVPPDLHARIGRLLSNPGVPVFLAVPALLLGIGMALWLQPAPHSDWDYYWSAAGSYSAYERGGAGLWLLAIPKLLGLSPAVSALWLNLPSAVLILWISWRADRRGAQGLWLASAAYLALLAPYFGLVQLDLLATTLLALGLWLGATARSRSRPNLSFGGGLLLVAAAVSTRPQFALTLWTMLALLVVPWLLWRKRETPAMAGLLIVLCAGSLLGFAVDNALRGMGGRGDSMRTSSAVTLYAGLLSSTDETGRCGRWSLDATLAARADLGKPLIQAVGERLSARPASHWMSVLGCKFSAIVLTEPYALAWLGNAPNVRAAMDSAPNRDMVQERYFRALRIERSLYGLVSLAILIMSLATSVVLLKRQRTVALLPVAWILSFWLVHLVFEIQGRYFLAMYLLAPLVCMLALSMSAAPGGRRAEATRSDRATAQSQG